MIITTNMTNAREDVERYADGDDLRLFLKSHGLDGVELMPMGGDTDLHGIPADAVRGIHLPIRADWYDFWRGNEAALLREFGNLKTVEAFYGGTSPRVLVDGLRGNLELARRLHVKYVVFHVSNVTLRETVSYRPEHADENICAAAAEIINAALDGADCDFEFLMENLWWPGLTLTRPEITRDLLAAVRCPKKGIMLDTGHLMHTDLDLKTQREGIAYIERCLDKHGALCASIRGVHLHQSLTGAYVRKMLKRAPRLTGEYWDDFGMVYRHILQIDRHLPFDDAGVRDMLRRIDPAYLTHEFITKDRAEHEDMLKRQERALSDGGQAEQGLVVSKR